MSSLATSVTLHWFETEADGLGALVVGPDHVTLGMKVRLTTFPVGTDEAGTEAINFGFEPIS